MAMHIFVPALPALVGSGAGLYGFDQMAMTR